MKKNTKIIIITVVAVALVALVVWYFGFYKKKAEEQKEEKVQNEEREENLSVVNRTDYGKAPAASYRLNQDLNKKLVAKLGIIPSDEIFNTGIRKR